jgi:cytochrome c553
MKRILKWGLRIGGGLLVLVIVAVGAAYGVAEAKMRKDYGHVREPITPVTPNAALIAEGRRQATIRGCNDCHGADMGGNTLVDQFPVGRISGSNLTRGKGGVGARYATDDAWARAILHGVGSDGRPLLLMPSQEFQGLTDADVAALVAYLRTLPPVDRETPANAVWPMGRALVAAGVLPLAAEVIDHDAPRVQVQPAPTAEYGARVAGVCTGCHGPGLSGGKGPGEPADWKPSANLTPDRATGLGTWTEADFLRAMRTGKRPDGTAIQDPMPWKAVGMMSDAELRAMWMYLHTLPPVEQRPAS